MAKDLFGAEKPPRPLTAQEKTWPGAQQGWNKGLAFAAIATDSELGAEIAKAARREREYIDCDEVPNEVFFEWSAYRQCLDWVEYKRREKYREREMLRV